MYRSSLARIVPIAEDQWGLITSRQISRAGVDPDAVHRLVEALLMERVAHGVYRIAGAPAPDHMELRAAWMQLAPDTPIWQRTAEQGVVSHRSAAAVYGLGHLPADRHEFTLPARRQSRRADVRFHRRRIARGEYVTSHGLLVTRPSRTASDLLDDREDPGAVAQVIADAIRGIFDYPGAFADSLDPQAVRFGFRRGDGMALLGWLLELTGDPGQKEWLALAREHVERSHQDLPPPNALARPREGAR